MKRFLITGIFLFQMSLIYSQFYNILNYGAMPDSLIINTKAIQEAIDSCYFNGGGTVIIPQGAFVTGTLLLKDNVNLHLEHNSKLIASTDTLDFPSGGGKKSLIFINNANNVSIDGKGIIDGRGSLFQIDSLDPDDRPFLIWVNNSQNIRIENLTLKNSAYWTLWLRGNQYVRIKGLNIYSHANLNNDGIDIDSKDVIITDCIIDTDDDALCFKSHRMEPCENVVVSNCILASNCNFIKMGTRSQGGFRNITITNCVLRPASESNFRFWNYYLTKYLKAGITDSVTGISGIALEVVDGGFMDQVTISNITMSGVQTPIFIRLGNRTHSTGSLRNVLISNITATSRSLIASSITGIPGFYVENLMLKNIIINSLGGCSESDLKMPVPEAEKEYPENRMFYSNLPAYGFYIRHAKNITLDNIQLNIEQPDIRPAIWLEDAHNISIQNLLTNKSAPKNSIVKRTKTSKIRIQLNP